MKICAAQTRPIKGNIPANIENHIKFIHLAVSNAADIIIFPELSLTGYEPELSTKWATNLSDSRFNEFQNISNAGRIIIGIGVPIKSSKGIFISMVLFQPYKERELYSEKYLHSDEKEFFVSGQNLNIALAICYEISIPEHAEMAFQSGAQIYLSSVANFVNGIDTASARLSYIVRKNSMTVAMSNCIGRFDGDECAGRTSIWNNQGFLAGQLGDKNEGILIFDTESEELIISTF